MNIRFDYIGIIAADIAESLRFYRLLGVDVADPVADEPHIETVLPSGLRMAWDSLALMQELDPDWVQPIGQRMGLGFLCESPSEVDEAHQQIIEAGFDSKRTPWDAFWGQRYAIVMDPDGNEVSLFAWAER